MVEFRPTNRLAPSKVEGPRLVLSTRRFRVDVTFLDIFLWVLSFIAFVFFLIFLLGIFFSMLNGEVDAVPFFILGAISLGCFAARLSVI